MIRNGDTIDYRKAGNRTTLRMIVDQVNYADGYACCEGRLINRATNTPEAGGVWMVLLSDADYVARV